MQNGTETLIGRPQYIEQLKKWQSQESSEYLTSAK